MQISKINVREEGHKGTSCKDAEKKSKGEKNTPAYRKTEALSEVEKKGGGGEI